MYNFSTYKYTNTFNIHFEDKEKQGTASTESNNNVSREIKIVTNRSCL